MKYSVVIPCFNEEKGIGNVVNNLPKDDCEIIVVDNNSSDQTAEIARKAGAKIVPETQKGYGYALKKGFASAIGEYIITLAGDGQYPANQVEELVSMAIKDNYDLLSCSRFPIKNSQSLSFARKLGNLFLTTLANIIFGISLKDSQSGMFIFKKSIYNSIAPKSNDMPLSQEIKIRAFLNPKFKCGETWIPYQERLGDSKLFPIRHGIINALGLFSLRSELKKNRNGFK